MFQNEEPEDKPQHQTWILHVVYESTGEQIGLKIKDWPTTHKVASQVNADTMMPIDLLQGTARPLTIFVLLILTFASTDTIIKDHNGTKRITAKQESKNLNHLLL